MTEKKRSGRSGNAPIIKKFAVKCGLFKIEKHEIGIKDKSMPGVFNVEIFLRNVGLEWLPALLFRRVA